VSITFGSLFAGIGGMDLGLERAGMECRWQVEIDPFCRKVLTKHWPEVPKYGDVTKLDGSELEPVDLICGGFPCQDISTAGRRAGISGPHSGLFREAIRCVRLVRPGGLLLENVAALLQRGMGTLLGELAEEGFDAEWNSVSTADLGAPAVRDRVFTFAYPPSNRLEGHVGGVIAQVPQDGPPKTLDAWNASSSPFREWEKLLAESRIIRVPGGFASRVDRPKQRLKAIGNCVSPQVAEWIGRRIITAMEAPA
jgi:DNA (cytosine-5)-methyltransferase 1